MKLTINTALIFLLFIGCTRKRIGNDSFVTIKDGEGNLKSEIHYINDTMMHGLAKYYYSKSRLKDEIEYKNGVKEGLYKHYRKDGTLESKTYFKKNVPDGETFWYFENGKIKEKTFWIRGKQYGDSYYYGSNGNLEAYNCIDFLGKALYVISWDSLGNKTIEEGLVYSPRFIAIYKDDSTDVLLDEVVINKEIILKYTVAQPPKTKTIVKIGELNKNNIVELPIKNYTVTYNQTFSETGKYNLVIVGEIKDLQGNLIKHDSTAFVITVVNQ